MTHRVRSAFGRFVALGYASLVALLVAASSLAAQQTTGKIEGSVTDQQGGPVGNAQVTIVGTSFGALTNDKGYYFINNVPVGTYTVRGRFIGFTAAEVPGVRVQGGFTQTVNIKLTPSAVAIGPVTVEVAANPIVPRDKVTSGSTVSGDLVAHLPVDDVRQVLTFQPGVVESGAVGGVSIRGGRPGEANIYIDGAPVRLSNGALQNASGGTLSGPIRVGTNALEEASVTTGALGVEFSDAQSGVIAYTTKAGGEKLAGSLSSETDEPFGTTISVGYNRFEGALGGPVPKVNNLRWFGSAVLQGQSADFRGKDADSVPIFTVAGVDAVIPDAAPDGTVSETVLPRFVQYSGHCGQLGSDATPLAQAIRSNYGFACRGRMLPLNWTTLVELQGNLQYTYGSGSSVRFTGVANGTQQRFSPGTDLADPARFRGQHTWQRLGVLNWNHQVARSAERALSLNLNLSWARDRAITGPLDPASDIETRDPTMGIEFKSLRFSGLEGFPFPITDQVVRDVRSNNTAGLIVPLLNRFDLNNAQAGRMNPYGLQAGAFYTSGMNTTATLYSETRYIGRLVVDWQANRYHRFTLGGDAKKTDLSYWSGGLLTPIFMDAYVVHPVQYGLFAADRLDLGDVVLELGLRWDYYNSKALFSNTPAFTFGDPAWDPDATTDDAAYESSLARVFTPSVGHRALSPRLRVSFPVTEKTGFRLSYSHQVQSPEFTTLLSGTNNDLSFTNSNDAFGRDVRFGKTILFEFGVRHAFSQDLVLDVSAYNKDKVSDLAYRILPFTNPQTGAITSLNVLTNADFGNAKGVDFKLDYRLSTAINASLAYTFQVSKSTGSDPFTYLNTFARQISALTGDRTLPPEQAQRTNDDRTHNIVGALAFTVPTDWKKGTPLGQLARDVNAFVTFFARSGLPYTLLDNRGDGQTAPRLNFGGGRADENLNASVLPWTRQVDVRVNKGFRVGRFDWTLYADVRNVFDFKNIEGVYAETGDVTNALLKTQLLSPEVTNLRGEATLAGALRNGAVDLTLGCGGWGIPADCEALKRVEARYGNGDGIYTEAEWTRAFDAYFNAFRGPHRFNGQPRHIRIGAELNF
ncbi:MAG TPA: TonB-dependent receptor [Gemmatimonadales bacterium]|nr:TonB-dependent receptor [Gemmatimonadales bacterium]